jgi:hypothetical protein
VVNKIYETVRIEILSELNSNALLMVAKVAY